MAARNPKRSGDKVVIPIAGIMNPMVRTHMPKVRVVSTATFHFGRLRHSFEEDGWAVEEPIVPPMLGLKGVQGTNDSLQDVIEHKLGKHPDKQALLVGHSLGGFVAARYATLHSADERIIGGITLDTPHESYFSGVIGSTILKTLSWIARPEDFTAETARLAEEAQLRGHAPNLVLIGSSTSNMIDTRGALPNIAGARRYALVEQTPGPSPDVGITNLTGRRHNHIQMVSDQDVIDFMVNIADSMAATPSQPAVANF